MRQGVLKKRSPLKTTTVAVLLVLLSSFGHAYAAAEQGNYFYLQESTAEDLPSSCATVFADIRAGKAEDVGAVVKSLKTINVTYLLDDYDNVLSADRRKQNYLTYEVLMAEVAASKRESYCRIELALYMQNQQVFAGPVYDELLREAFEKLDETYAEALRSFRNEQFARAAYAFDLITPYHDAHQMQLLAVNQLEEKATKKVPTAAEPDAEPIVGIEKAATADKPGPISRAFFARRSVSETLRPDSVGPIARAARPGPITEAISTTE